MHWKRLTHLKRKINECELPPDRKNLATLSNIEWLLKNIHERNPRREDLDEIQRMLVEVKQEVTEAEA